MGAQQPRLLDLLVSVIFCRLIAAIAEQPFWPDFLQQLPQQATTKPLLRGLSAAARGPKIRPVTLQPFALIFAASLSAD